MPLHTGLQRLHAALWATRAQFALLGLGAGAWGVHIPSVQSAYGLDAGLLSLVLLAAGVGALGALFVAGRLVGRWGAGGTAWRAAVVLGGTLALVLGCGSMALLLPLMLLLGMGLSVFDVAINTEGTALEQRSQRSVMSQLHGGFSLGAMAGAALCAAWLRAGVDPVLQLALVGAGMAVASAVASRWMLPLTPPAPQREPAPAESADLASRSSGPTSRDQAANPTPPEPHFIWPRGRLLLIGAMVFAGLLAEGVVVDWCVLYLRDERGLSQDRAAWGYAAFTGAMAVARFGGDALRSRWGDLRLLSASALLATLAMALALLSPTPALSIVALALVGIGLAPAVPIFFMKGLV
jgi:predicted MFS family arabinose efflux permease